MNPRITIVSEGVDESKVKSALESIPDMKLRKLGQDKGLVENAGKAIKFVAEFAGGPTAVADLLLKQAAKITTNAMTPAKVMVKISNKDGTEKVVEVTNVNRSQVIDVLNAAKEMTKTG